MNHAILHWVRFDDGWLVTCPTWPAWRYKAPAYTAETKKRAKASLCKHRNKQLVVVHEAWDDRT